ncbi:MAG TPA: HAD family phosphatase [Flavitalea sp.]|nr:HAD family phosphatase [Flavitalea sp.]
MSKINTIIFDLGGVLIDWNPDYVFKSVFNKEEEMKWFYSNICTPDWNEEQDAGRTLTEGTELLVKQFPQHEKNIRAYYDRWEEMLGGPIDGTVEIFRKLKKNPSLKFYALTNWSYETFPIALKKYEFLHWFDGKMVSGEEKMRKPFLQFYQLLIDRFKIDPTRSVYIDDNARNLPPAASLGMSTIHFKNPEQFGDEMQRLGLK